MKINSFFILIGLLMVFGLLILFSGCSVFDDNLDINDVDEEMVEEEMIIDEDTQQLKIVGRTGVHNDEVDSSSENAGYEEATFAGGCFWCIEAAYDGASGIISAVSGYTGGDEENPSYYQVASGETGHREAVRIVFDPNIVSYEELVNIFWRQIDPTDSGGQFADRGHHYTTAIYYHDEEQLMVAERTKKEQENSGRFGSDEFVTEILEVKEFWEAEEEHQNYAQKRSIAYSLYKKGSGRSGYLDEKWGE